MENAYVVLLHGLGRSTKSMGKMAQFLERFGYTVVNLGYFSKRYPLETLGDQLAEKITAACPDINKPLHFVAHSMGALIAHFYIKKYRPVNLGRVVALGAPYHGSAIIDHLGRYFWYRKLHGPAALEIGTASPGIVERLGTVNYELGSIAGDHWIFYDWFFTNYWLKKPNDGKVEVASTHIEGCRDHIVLPVNHIYLPSFLIAQQQAYYFLAHGCFKRF